MNLRARQADSPDINLTPLIDVVFLLLIFFMVSTTFERESQLQIELPEASEKPSDIEEENTIEVTIDAKGRFYVNSVPLVNTQLNTVKSAIRKVAGDRDDPPIVISADRNAKHQSVVTVMNALLDLGFVRFKFPTQEVESPAQ